MFPRSPKCSPTTGRGGHGFKRLFGGGWRGEEGGAPAPAELGDGDLAGPGAVDLVEYPGYHLEQASHTAGTRGR